MLYRRATILNQTNPTEADPFLNLTSILTRILNQTLVLKLTLLNMTLVLNLTFIVNPKPNLFQNLSLIVKT